MKHFISKIAYSNYSIIRLVLHIQTIQTLKLVFVSVLVCMYIHTYKHIIVYNEVFAV